MKASPATRITVKFYNMPKQKRSFFRIFGNHSEKNTDRTNDMVKVYQSVLGRFNIAHIELKENIVRIQSIKGERMDIEFNEFGQALCLEIAPQQGENIGTGDFSVNLDGIIEEQ